ncbi:hypothetical protein LCGC14_0537300 [marine sediment metagenome]|uniref:HNH nuclease domain-containing protein n=1 Tax=marine sediment metagenome TaxID=412755 RepID=A0A0F9RTX9_9ZZZZ
MKRLDLTRQRFGRWVVLKDAGNEKWGGSQWLCKCDCGTEKIIPRYNLLVSSRSCGCLQKELLSKRAKQFLGNKNPNWKDGIAVGRERGLRYKQWRIKVFKRDDFTCQICGQKGGYKEAHHIYPFGEHADLRFEIWNGITLCKKPCHANIKRKEYKFVGKFLNITTK